MSKQGRFEKPKKKKKSSAGKVLLIILCVLLLLVAALAVAGVLYYRSMISKLNFVQMPPNTEPSYVETEPVTQPTTVPPTTQETTEAPTEETVREPMKPEDIVNILVAGLQGRPGEEAMMADTLILVSLNTYTNTVTLTSFLRDTYLNTPAYGSHDPGKTKLNMVYAVGYTWGGAGVAMDYMNRTLMQNFGVEVDYNVELNLYDFPEIINMLGGVDLELTQAEANYLNDEGPQFYMGYKVKPGMTHLEGWGTLCYVRMRHAEGDNDSDIVRTERQRKMVTALLEKLRSSSLLEIQKLVDKTLPLITTNMDIDAINSLVIKAVPMLPSLKIETAVCPHKCWGSLKDIFGNGVPLSILEFEPNVEKAFMRPITEGVEAE